MEPGSARVTVQGRPVLVGAEAPAGLGAAGAGPGAEPDDEVGPGASRSFSRRFLAGFLVLHIEHTSYALPALGLSTAPGGGSRDGLPRRHAGAPGSSHNEGLSSPRPYQNDSSAATVAYLHVLHDIPSFLSFVRGGALSPLELLLGFFSTGLPHACSFPTCSLPSTAATSLL